MQEFTYTIQDADGIHARPAGLLVKEAGRFSSAITLHHEGKSGDAKRIFSVMSLGIRCGTKVRVTVEGEDEDEAAEALKKFLSENL